MGLTLLLAFSVASDLADSSLVALPIDSPVFKTTEACVNTRIGRELTEAAAQYSDTVFAPQAVQHDSDFHFSRTMLACRSPDILDNLL